MRNSTAAPTDWSAILADAVNKPGVISNAYSNLRRADPSRNKSNDCMSTEIAHWNELLALHNLGIERLPFRDSDNRIQGYSVGRQIAVSPLAFMPHRTLFHEMAHVILGHTMKSKDVSDAHEHLRRDVREVEAESVALICCEALGLPAAEFSRGYIQHWLKLQPIAEKSVHRIFKAADAILKAGRPASDSPEP